jgi:hypothetical protein
MAVTRTCSSCGHQQMIGYNPVDGRVKWWTSCERCRTGNFMAPPDPRLLRLLSRIHRRREEP